MDGGEHKVKANMKPECIVSSSSGYHPIKSEETDDEDMHKDTNTSNSHENINMKEEAVKVEVKEKEDISTDDERSPEYVISSSSGYDLVKSEETDDEELGEDNNISNEKEDIKVKAEAKTKNDLRTDDNDSEKEEAGKRRKSPRLLTISATQSNAFVQESIDIQRTTKKRRYIGKRKRKEGKVIESNGSVDKAARIECSVEGCTGKAADSGTCGAKHGGYKYCSQEDCTSRVWKGGVCRSHKEFAIDKKAARIECSVEECNRKAADSGTCSKHGGYNHCSKDGCTNRAKKGGVCIKHGAVVKKKTCNHEGCTNKVQIGGVCAKHGAKRVKKTCSYDGCTNQAKKGGICIRHGAIVKQKSKAKCSHEAQTMLLIEELVLSMGPRK